MANSQVRYKWIQFVKQLGTAAGEVRQRHYLYKSRQVRPNGTYVINHGPRHVNLDWNKNRLIFKG